MHTLRLLPLLLLAFTSVACTTTGIEPLGKLRDRATNCGKSSYIRTTDTGTEVFLFGSSRPELATPNPLPTNPETGEEIPTCLAYAFVEHNSTSFIEYGSYTLDASGNGLFTLTRRSSYLYDPLTPIGRRSGAQQDDTPMPATREIAVAADGEELIVTLDGEKRRVTNFYDVIARVDADTQAGAEDIFRLLNIPLFTSQPRITKFGSVGMTDYLKSPATFTALVTNDFSVSMGGDLKVTIAYHDFEDLHGIVITGDQITKSNLQGVGTMSGVLNFTMRGSETAEDVVVQGTLDYGEVKLDNGVAAAGFYPFTVNGKSYEISYELAADVDLRGLLPPSTP